MHTADKRVFVETIDCQSVRNGNQWIVNFLKSAYVEQIVIDGASRQKILADELKDYHVKNVVLPTVKEIITANSMWEQAIYQKRCATQGSRRLAESQRTVISVALAQAAVLGTDRSLMTWISVLWTARCWRTGLVQPSSPVKAESKLLAC